MMQLALDNSSFRPGDRIAGKLVWSDLPVTTGRLEVRLVWHTVGKGDRDFEVMDRVRIAKPQASGEQQFVFAAPLYPPSFSGKLISVVWIIEAILFPQEIAEQESIVIAPFGKELSASSRLATFPAGEVEGRAGEARKPVDGSRPGAFDQPLEELDEER